MLTIIRVSGSFEYKEFDVVDLEDKFDDLLNIVERTTNNVESVVERLMLKE